MLSNRVVVVIPNAKNVRLDTVSDWIQKRFGPAALARAAELVHASD